MPYLIAYFSIIFLELFFAIGMFVYVSSLLYSGIMGAPYVPSRKKEVAALLSEAGLKKGQYMIELGSGDGRVLTHAALTYGVKGHGVDISPLMVMTARIRARLKGARGITFRTQNLWKTDLSKADVLYLFLLPEMLKKLAPRFVKLKRGTRLISHGFRIEGLEKKLIRTREAKPFPTYYYKI